jgi:hypothetical protein
MKKIPWITLSLVLLLVNFLYGTIELTNESNGDFTHVIQEGIAFDNNPLIKDVALLGAHDAFSHDIHLLSALDPAESPDALVSQTPLRFLIGGLFVRYARAQTVGTETLLNRGVRYFDVRVSYHQEKWVTKHGLISNDMSRYLLPMITFLNDHPGEFVILDFQHVYLGTQTYEDLFEAIAMIQVNGLSLFDFVHYSTTFPIHALTYDDVTDQKSKAGVVFLFNTPEEVSNFRHYSRLSSEENIRSTWHDTAHLPTLMTRIEDEHAFISALPERHFLSVNQAQRTSNFSSGLWDTLVGWSLIAMASEGNAQLLHQESFTDWFTSMPILMVDFATTNHGGFNVLVNEAIIAYNLTL